MEIGNIDYGALKAKLKTMLSPDRYRHSIGVMDTAEELARNFGEDAEKAKLAGLLHDCAKEIDKGIMVDMCDELGVELDPTKREQRSLIHADLGAKLLETEFGIFDEAVALAVKNHTLGRENMTDLEKILYLADMLEPNRKPFPGLEEIRQTAMADLDCAMLCAVDRTVDYLMHKHKPLHSQTLATQQYFAKICKKKG